MAVSHLTVESLVLKSHGCSHRLTSEYSTVFWLCWHKHVYLLRQLVKPEKVPGLFLLWASDPEIGQAVV